MAIPKDEYPMPISDLLIDAAANHEMLSFMDDHADYNQIFIVEADVHKTTFHYLGVIETYEWVVMHSALKALTLHTNALWIQFFITWLVPSLRSILTML